MVVWKEGHKLVLMIYKTTKCFPKDETYGLSSQMRRCAVSVTSNLAEGFSRRSRREKLQFYYIAVGSITELQNQLLVARDIGYIDKGTFNEVAGQTVVVYKLTNGLIKSSRSIRSKIPNTKY